MALPGRRATHHLSTVLSCCAAAVVAAGAALLAFSDMARATPVNFVLSDVTGHFFEFPPIFSFSGSFTFDSSTLTETNIDVSASPTNASNPVIVTSYTADGGLCAIFTSSTQPCFTDAADDNAIYMAVGSTLDGTTTTAAVTELGVLNSTGGNSFAQYIFFTVTGHVDVAAVPAPPLSNLAALGMLGLAFFWRRRRQILDRVRYSTQP